MPKELVAIAPRTPALREFEPPPVGPGMVKLIAEFGAPKHGTEMMGYRNVAATSGGRYDPEMRCFVPSTDGSSRFPRGLGNMVVGRIAEVGEGVDRFAAGDRVYGHMQLREVNVVPAQRLRPLPPDLSPEAAMCTDPADAALAIRDARIKLGADLVLDPTEGDVGLEIHRLTGKLGVDVALEVSGNSRALHQAIRATRFEGTVGVIASYAGGAEHLHLGNEFHWNAIQLISCRTVSLPLRDYGWDHERLVDLAEDLIRSGKVRTDGIIYPIVPFEAAAEAYRMIDEHPEHCIKLGVRFSGA